MGVATAAQKAALRRVKLIIFSIAFGAENVEFRADFGRRHVSKQSLNPQPLQPWMFCENAWPDYVVGPLERTLVEQGHSLRAML